MFLKAALKRIPAGAAAVVLVVVVVVVAAPLLTLKSSFACETRASFISMQDCDVDSKAAAAFEPLHTLASSLPMRRKEYTKHGSCGRFVPRYNIIIGTTMYYTCNMLI